MAQEAAPPPGFEVVKSSTPAAVVKPKVPETPAQPAPAQAAPVAEAEPEAPAAEAAPAEAATEPTDYDRAKKAADKAIKGAAANRRLREQGVQLQQQLQQQQQHTAQIESRLQQATQHLDNVMRDPLAALKALGKTPADIARAAALEGSPEGQIEALRAELAETKKRLDAQAEAARASEERTRRASIENAYKQEAQNAKKYPNLANVHPDFVLSRTKDLLTELCDRGHDPSKFSNHQILSYLNDSYAPKQQTPAPAPSEAAPETSGKKTNTITNKLASAKQAAPVDFSKMSDRQQRKVMAQQMRDAGLGH